MSKYKALIQGKEWIIEAPNIAEAMITCKALDTPILPTPADIEKYHLEALPDDKNAS